MHIELRAYLLSLCACLMASSMPVVCMHGSKVSGERQRVGKEEGGEGKGSGKHRYFTVHILHTLLTTDFHMCGPQNPVHNMHYRQAHMHAESHPPWKPIHHGNTYIASDSCT